MKNVFLIVLREIGVAILILVVLAAVTVIAFKDQLPYDEKVPSGEQYTKVNMRTYSVSSTDRISEIEAVTITHETNQHQIISAENDVRIQTGKYTPFGTIDGTSDLPSERVGISISSLNGSGDNTSSSSNNGETQSESLSYPSVPDDPVKQIEEDQSQDSSSLAQQRMGNI